MAVKMANKCSCGKPAEPGSAYCKRCKEAKIKEVDERLERHMDWRDEDDEKKEDDGKVR